MAGFAAGVVPFGDVEPGWAGELLGFPNGQAWFGFGIEKLCGGEMVEQAHDGKASEVGACVEPWERRMDWWIIGCLD